MSVALDAGRWTAHATSAPTTLTSAPSRPGVGPDHATLALEAVPAAVAGARRWICARVAAAGGDHDTVALAELLASEVVTNAVRHGDPGGLVTVTVAPTRTGLRVAVTDAGAGRPVVREEADDAGGRGLQLVDSLAATWGVAEQAVGKSVWFELALSR